MFNLNHRILTIVDQLLLSAIGLVTSAAIVKLGNIEELGIYGAYLAVVTLLQTSYSSLVSGQMLLHISSKSEKTRDTFFRLTGVIWLFYSLVGISSAFLLSIVISLITDNFQSKTVFFAGLCVISLSLFEQHRKLLYVKKCFLISFVCTCIFIATHLAVSYYFVTENLHYYSAKDAFLSLAIAYFMAALFNPVVIHSIKNAKNIKLRGAWMLHKKYLEQGRFAIGGLSLAWVQNQSISLYFLVIFGPTIAGLYNFGRMITMPIMVVNVGLINGISPTLRILGAGGKLGELRATTSKYALLSLGINFIYAIIIVVALKIEWVVNLQEDLSNASNYVYFWLILTTGIVWRTWVTQFLIANLKFKTLLKFNAFSAFVTLSGIAIFTLLGFSPLIIASVMLVGEAVIYAMVKSEQNRMFKFETSD